MWKARNFILGQNLGRITMPHFHILQIVATFRNHAQIRIERNTHSGIKGDLKGRAHVLRSHGGDQLFGRNNLGNFPHELFPLVGFLLGFALFEHFLLFFLVMVVVGHDGLHLGFVNLKSRKEGIT
jgi:hypothetical protein